MTGTKNASAKSTAAYDGVKARYTHLLKHWAPGYEASRKTAEIQAKRSAEAHALRRAEAKKHNEARIAASRAAEEKKGAREAALDRLIANTEKT